jgi:hypothetical protein
LARGGRGAATLFVDISGERIEDHEADIASPTPACNLTHRHESSRLISMTKRLQVLLEEDELEQVQAAARSQRMTTAEWVRSSLRSSLESERGKDPAAKLEALATASRHAFPTGDIEQVLDEIESGYLDLR